MLNSGNVQTCVGWMATRLATGILIALTGCSQAIPPDPGPPPLPPLAVPMGAGNARGSLWRADRAANYPFLDVRPRFPGDLLTIVISEDVKGKKDADTKLSSDSSVSASVEEFFGIPSFGNINPSNVVSAESARSFLRLAFPAKLAHQWMPGLFPEQP